MLTHFEHGSSLRLWVGRITPFGRDRATHERSLRFACLRPSGEYPFRGLGESCCALTCRGCLHPLPTLLRRAGLGAGHPKLRLLLWMCATQALRLRTRQHRRAQKPCYSSQAQARLCATPSSRVRHTTCILRVTSSWAYPRPHSQ